MLAKNNFQSLDSLGINWRNCDISKDKKSVMFKVYFGAQEKGYHFNVEVFEYAMTAINEKTFETIYLKVTLEALKWLWFTHNIVDAEKIKTLFLKLAEHSQVKFCYEDNKETLVEFNLLDEMSEKNKKDYKFAERLKKARERAVTGQRFKIPRGYNEKIEVKLHNNWTLENFLRNFAHQSHDEKLLFVKKVIFNFDDHLGEGFPLGGISYFSKETLLNLVYFLNDHVPDFPFNKNDSLYCELMKLSILKELGS